jgi:hypothetical protein
MSAGLDEVPMAYKDIDQVMAAQQDLVEPLARFDPRSGEKWRRVGSRTEDEAHAHDRRSGGSGVSLLAAAKPDKATQAALTRE